MSEYLCGRGVRRVRRGATRDLELVDVGILISYGIHGGAVAANSAGGRAKALDDKLAFAADSAHSDWAASTN